MIIKIHSRVPLQCSLTYHDIISVNVNAVTEVKHRAEFVLSSDTPYLTLTGELWSVYCEDFGENWLHFNGMALYVFSLYMYTFWVSGVVSISPRGLSRLCFLSCLNKVSAGWTRCCILNNVFSRWLRPYWDKKNSSVWMKGKLVSWGSWAKHGETWNVFLIVTDFHGGIVVWDLAMRLRGGTIHHSGVISGWGHIWHRSCCTKHVSDAAMLYAEF